MAKKELAVVEKFVQVDSNVPLNLPSYKVAPATAVQDNCAVMPDTFSLNAVGTPHAEDGKVVQVAAHPARLVAQSERNSKNSAPEFPVSVPGDEAENLPINLPVLSTPS